MEIVIISGVAQNRVIGNKGELPWHIKGDLQHFKELTMGKPVIMGKITYDSIVKMLGKPLPGRKNIVLTYDDFETFPDVILCRSLEEGIERAKEFSDSVFMIGGQSVYKQTIDMADRLEITKIHKDYEGDTFFPEIDEKIWEEIKKEDVKGEEVEYSFITYKRKKKGMFIAFEGIDGCGKSTQMKKFTHYLFSKDKHNHIVLTRNPYKDANIRKVIVRDDNPQSEAELLADMFISDRKNHTAEVVIPNINNGHFVVSDRYKLSTIAYQSAQGMDMNSLIEKHNTNDFLIPDVTFIVDVSSEVAAERMKKGDVSLRGKEHKFEADLGFSKLLRENYLKAKETLSGEKIFIIDGHGSEDYVFNQIKDIYEKEFGR